MHGAPRKCCKPRGLTQPDGQHLLSFSVLLPARHEEAVLAASVNQLLASVHSSFEVIIIVGHDDDSTTEVARSLEAEHPQRVRVVVDTHDVKNKPKALNTALPMCRGDVVGVFDAEDHVHPKLLDHVDYAFRVSHADVVQGGVQLVNFYSSWYSLRNCLEYFFWFRSRLHLHAQKGFIPLGGNTVFVRADLLAPQAAGTRTALPRTANWVSGCRPGREGGRRVRRSHGDSRGDAGLIDGLYRQRTRWNQGFLQVYRKGYWKQLPTCVNGCSPATP